MMIRIKSQFDEKISRSVRHNTWVQEKTREGEPRRNVARFVPSYRIVMLEVP